MEFLTILMDMAPMPPVEPGLWAKFVAAVSAFAGGIVFCAVKLVKKVFKGKKEEKK
ncbi:MAG: hypothetical protein IKL18_01530 [Oscillospiraceae bacterium]|nr:hypothetical protein [Oscillospiraceae bacterium]MBR6656835.1 hypothetical protein [Oscillospiraceae bacterium]